MRSVAYKICRVSLFFFIQFTDLSCQLSQAYVNKKLLQTTFCPRVCICWFSLESADSYQKAEENLLFLEYT